MQYVETQYNLAGWVHMGDYLMPAGWVARYDDPTYPYVAELRVVMEDGGDFHPVCEAVTLMKRDDGPPIQGAALRLPISQILKVTAASVALRAISGDHGKWAPVGDDDLAQFFKKFHVREHPPGRHRVDDERLREVARAYQNAAPTRAPVEAVRVAFTVSRSHAARLVQTARRRTDPETGKTFLPAYSQKERLADVHRHAKGSSMDASKSEGDAP